MTTNNMTGTPQPITITLTLPHADTLSKSGTLLIQRGDLAKLFQFHYTNTGDMASAIHDATEALIALENNPPPVIPDTPPRKTAIAAAPTLPAEPPEPMIQVPTKTKKGTTAVPARCLRIVDGETGEDAQQQAIKIAGRLLDSGLWDGKTPIGINDVYAVQLSLDGLTDKELKVLFTLEQFVQVNPETSATDEAQDTDNSLQDNQDDVPVPAGLQVASN